jgi:hypothetical protein
MSHASHAEVAMRMAHKVGVTLVAIALMLLLLLIPRHGHGQSTQDFGAYVVHYSAISTQQLQPEMAAQYGITRAENRGLLNVALQAKEGDAAMVRAEVSATVADLVGHSIPLHFRETNENDAFDYLADFPLSGSGTYVFTVKVTPAGQPSQPYVVRFNQDYVVD